MRDVLSRRQIQGLNGLGIQPGSDMRHSLVDLVSTSSASDNSSASSLTSGSRSARGRGRANEKDHTPHPASGRPPLKRRTPDNTFEVTHDFKRRELDVSTILLPYACRHCFDPNPSARCTRRS